MPRVSTKNAISKAGGKAVAGDVTIVHSKKSLDGRCLLEPHLYGRTTMK